MKLEIGKRYVCRNGGITGPMQRNPSEYYPYMADDPDGLSHSWTAKGRFWRDNQSAPWDIMSEYVEPPAPIRDMLIDDLIKTRVPVSPGAGCALTLPGDSEAREDVPLYSGCYAYFPAALAGVAKHSKAGNDKHNPGQPIHHARGKSTDHQDCIARHLADLGDLLARQQRNGTAEHWNPEEWERELFTEANALCWRALAFSQELHERFGGAPLAPGARLPEPPTFKGAPVVLHGPNEPERHVFPVKAPKKKKPKRTK